MDLVLPVGVVWENDLQTMSTKWSGNAQGIRHSLNIKPYMLWSDFSSKIDSLVSFHCTHLLFSAGRERLNGKF